MFANCQLMGSDLALPDVCLSDANAVAGSAAISKYRTGANRYSRGIEYSVSWDAGA